MLRWIIIMDHAWAHGMELRGDSHGDRSVGVLSLLMVDRLPCLGREGNLEEGGGSCVLQGPNAYR